MASDATRLRKLKLIARGGAIRGGHDLGRFGRVRYGHNGHIRSSTQFVAECVCGCIVVVNLEPGFMERDISGSAYERRCS